VRLSSENDRDGMRLLELEGKRDVAQARFC